MNFTPEQDRKTTDAVSLALVIAGVAVLLCAPLVRTVAIVQLVGIALCSCGLFVLYRYGLTAFIYTVEDGLLTVHKVVGKRSTAVCRIPLAACDTFVPADRAPSGEKFRGGRYSYRVNLRPKSLYYLTFTDDGTRVRIALELSASAAACIALQLPPDAKSL